jgi:phosphatidylethanolamine/phosphatidyl-N-methylethanolamine N-methyltransferase
MALNTNWWNRVRYSLYAPVYNQIVQVFNAPRQRSIELLALKAGERVLLVGAGTGIDLRFIPDGVMITAIDITPAMVTRIRAEAASLGRPVEALVMDGQALQLPSEQFDAVVLHLILAVIPDPVASIQEAVRTLKPGGRAVIFDKFLPESERPSVTRRILNGVTSVLFTSINRKLAPLLARVPLTVVHEEPVPRLEKLGFRIVLLHKGVG